MSFLGIFQVYDSLCSGLIFLETAGQRRLTSWPYISIARNAGQHLPSRNRNAPDVEKAFPKEGRRYRVSVTVNGKTVTRMSLSLEEAKKAEADIRNDLSARATESKPQTITLMMWEQISPLGKGKQGFMEGRRI